jgi:hypothetical protein
MGHILRIRHLQISTENEAALSEKPGLSWPVLFISLVVVLNATSVVLTLLAS